MHPEDQAIADAWLVASADLGIHVTTPFQFRTGLGEQVDCILLVHGFGSAAGTVIATLNEPFNEFLEAAKAAGYYASALNPTHYAKYKRATFIDTLRDWAWEGPAQDAPSWYRVS